VVISSTVPIPATLWLLGSALSLLIVIWQKVSA